MSPWTIIGWGILALIIGVPLLRLCFAALDWLLWALHVTEPCGAALEPRLGGSWQEGPFCELRAHHTGHHQHTGPQTIRRWSLDASVSIPRESR